MHMVSLIMATIYTHRHCGTLVEAGDPRVEGLCSALMGPLSGRGGSHDTVLPIALRLTRVAPDRFICWQHTIGLCSCRTQTCPRRSFFSIDPDSSSVINMSSNEDYNDVDNGEDVGNAGPGAPTPLTALEVRVWPLLQLDRP